MNDYVIKALAEQLRVDEDKVKLNAKIKDDLGADSLDILQLLMTIEEEKGIQIPDESLSQIVIVQDIIDFLEKNQ